MAQHRRSKKQDSQSRRGAARRNVIGLSAAAGAFITIGLSPLVAMPVAKADGEDVIIDQIINSLSAVDPTAALDLSSWLSSLDAAMQGAANFDPSSFAGILPDVGGVPDVSAVPDVGMLPDVDSASAAASTAVPAADPAGSQSLADLYGEAYLSNHSLTRSG